MILSQFALVTKRDQMVLLVTINECYCKSNIIGDMCDKCIDGFFGFPNCQSKWFNFQYMYHAFPHQIIHFQAAIVKTRDQKI